MTTHVRLRFAAAVIAPFILVMAACGGSSSPKADPAADQAAATKAIAAFETELTADGFTGSANDEEEDPLELTSDECKKFNQFFEKNPIEGKTADVDSQSFDRGDLGADDGVAESVEGNVIVVSDAKAFDDEFDVLEDPALPDCVAEAFEKGFTDSASVEASDVTIGDLTTKRLTSSIAGVDHATGISVASTIETEGFEFPFTLDVRWVAQGRYGVMMMTSIIGPGDSTLDGEAMVEVILGALPAKV